jgi:general nucleoside transport system permease protein
MEASIYAGIKPARIIMIAMAISGGLAGLMAFHEILGAEHRLVIDFVQGSGFVGIAVALMGRSHPVGIVLAALLFGLLYQGGTELSFAIPAISRDMVVVIQGLVILFMGALEQTFRPYLGMIFARID